MFAGLIGAAVLTWYLDKTNTTDVKLAKPEGNGIKIDNKFHPVELGYGKQLAKNLPWGFERTRHIGDIDDTNPLPYINPQSGGENTNVTDMKQAILPDQRRNFARLVHQRENIEEYWRFDNYLGDTFPNNIALQRDSSIAYRYE